MFQELANYIVIEGEIYFTLYAWAVVLDILTGVACAIRLKRVYSKVGLNGMIRHLVILLLVILSTTILYNMGHTAIAHVFQFYIFLFYVLSVIENIDIIGGNFLPEGIEDFFQVLKTKQEGVLKTIITTEINTSAEKNKENLGE